MNQWWHPIHAILTGFVFVTMGDLSIAFWFPNLPNQINMVFLGSVLMFVGAGVGFWISLHLPLIANSDLRANQEGET